jgi:hypothetical protein
MGMGMKYESEPNDIYRASTISASNVVYGIKRSVGAGRVGSV